MSNNFRCDESIISFANLVCSHLFKTGGKEISYSDGDDLVFSKQTPEEYESKPVKVVLIDTKKDGDDAESGPYSDAESDYIANEIISLVNREKKANGDTISYSDVAVLYRSASFGAEVASALDRRGIPHTYGSTENIFDRPEVSLTLSLLHVIDNPRRDIHLASALISPIFGLTAEDLIKINEKCADEELATLYDRIVFYSKKESGSLSEKCASITDEINGLRRDAESMPADRIIRQIYLRYSLISSGGDAASAALTGLYENARSFEGDAFKGLYGYLKYVDDMIASGKTVSLEKSGGANAVQLMTIHKSKGLEFPVCFVGGCATPFNRDDTKDLMLYSQSLGIAMDLKDESGFGRLRTPFRSALSREIYGKLAEEEMRVLYVALTRARERLYVTASLRYGVENELPKARARRCAATRASILDCGNYISWILTATYGRESKFFSLDTVFAADIVGSTAEPELSNLPILSDTQKAFSEEELSKAGKHLEDIFAYQYPYLHISNLPAKLSVSKLSPGVLDRSEDKAEDVTADSLDTVLPEIIRTPRFMSEDDGVSAAQKGTDTHTYLQFCDFEGVEKYGVKNELDRLISHGFIEKRAEKTVDLDQIENFFSSSLYALIKSAARIHREQRFNILLPAKRFTEDPVYAKELRDESLLVQGVIDLVIECDDGRLILCDYKTDRLTSAELKNRTLAEKKLTEAHKRQLSYYAAAIKRLFGRSPDRVLIYSLPLGDTIEVMPESID